MLRRRMIMLRRTTLLLLALILLASAAHGQEQPPVRINVGSDTPYVDAFNNTWEADDLNSYFNTGRTYSSCPKSIANTTDDDLYCTHRYFRETGIPYRYEIPVLDGNYYVKLHFAETHFTDPNKRVFGIKVHDAEVVQGFDAVSAAGAANTAIVLSSQLVTVSDGILTIELVSSIQNPFISAIEVLETTDTVAPTVTPAPTPDVAQNIRINAGGPTYTDSNGDVWYADNYFGGKGKSASYNGVAIAGTMDDALYQTNRWFKAGLDPPFTYEIPISNGYYYVNLHFAETHFTDANRRVFGIKIQDVEVAQGFDAVSAAGAANTAIVLSSQLVTVSDGILMIELISSIQNPFISAIEVLETTDTAAPTISPAPTPDVVQTVRINAGGSAFTDSNGDVWYADNYFGGKGKSASYNGVAIAGTMDDALYQTNRWFKAGLDPPFTYEIPVSNGNYYVNLHFAETHFSEANRRVFDVKLQDSEFIQGLDVVAVAGGANTAVIRTKLATVTDDLLKIEFIPSIQNPLISAIEVVETFDATEAPSVLTLAPTSEPINTIYPSTITPTVLTFSPTPVPVATLAPSLSTEAPTDSTLSPTQVPAGITFKLIDISQDTETVLSNGDVISVPDMGPDFNVEAVLTGLGDSVKFDYNGQDNFKTEWTAPYAFCGDSGGNFFVCSELEAGQHTITATPFESGSPGTSAEITFTIIAAPFAPVAPTTPVPSSVPPTAPTVNVFPIRINCGGSDFTDSAGNFWAADAYFHNNGGTHYAGGCGIEDFYCSERFWNKWHGHTQPYEYEIPVPPGGVYQVDLYFAETDKESIGERFFEVWVEDTRVRSSLDIFEEAGGKNIPLIISETLVVADGGITIKFVDLNGGDTPKISGIEIVEGFIAPTISPAPTTEAPTLPGLWVEIDDDAPIMARHEACFVMVDNSVVGRRAYLVGGRYDRDLDIYDPISKNWTQGTKPPPYQLHHMQCVAAQEKLWIVSAWTDNFPTEKNAESIYVYDPASGPGGTWEEKTAMPENRRRGSSAVVVSEDESKIYVSHGNTGGHEDDTDNVDAVALPYLDEYDIATDTWTEISSSAPNPRDHTCGAMINGRLCVASGRDGGLKGWPGVGQTDCYNFATEEWEVEESIPQLRAGASCGTTCDGYLMVAGGEGGGTYTNVDVFNGTHWTSVASLNKGRHGSGLAVDCVCNQIHIASGSLIQGSDGESRSVETFYPDGVPSSCLA